MASQLKAARRELRALFPRGYELVYDNFNSLAIGIGPTDRGSSPILSIAGYPKWVTLFFLHGASLHDPDKLLDGTGSRVRSIRLKQPQDFRLPAVRKLIEQALRAHRAAFAEAPKLTTVIKAVAAKQRSRRPT